MVVTFRDKHGLVDVELSAGELGKVIHFYGGYAYFMADDGDYNVRVDSLVQISLVRDNTGREAVCGQKA